MANTRVVLDEAIRAHAADLVDDGELIVGWVVCAATRRADGGGVVLVCVEHDAVPRWQVKGILAEALDHARDYEEDDDDGL